ncbi:MAG TPA: HEAT repeat domain-containing protein [Xanthomonadales bacterium]|nr:HEAT repeat domain-containing protein [Xanthomonadales bacterium]
MKPIRSILAAAVFAALLGAGSLAAAPDPATAPTGEAARSHYLAGHEAIERGRWEEARQSFAALEKELRRTGADGADSALYWQAYALAQARRTADAARVVDRLEKEHPASPWNDDARALVAGRAAPRSGEGAREGGSDDAEALMAIDALLTSGNRKAVPLLQRVLAGDYSGKVKERALFVLTQIDPAAADQAFAAILAGDAPDRLKQEAIRSIAVGGSKASHERLLQVYRAGGNPKLRRAVLDAWLISGRGDLVAEAARNEADPTMRRHAINTLGAMGDVAAIRSLLPALTDDRSQQAAMQALGIAGAADALVEIARDTRAPMKMRTEAVEALGIVGKRTGPQVVDFYKAGQPEALRKAAIRALMMHGDGARLIEIYRVEHDPKLKRELLQAIAVSDSDGALDLIDEVLK